MAYVQQQIAKGLYQYSQIDRFVSIKEYMFIRKNNKKCLLLRFSNDADYTVDEMRYTVIQLDSSGNVIEKTKVEHKKLNFAPGSMIAPDSGIVVSDICHDFKIRFDEVRSGSYRYVVRNSKISVYYDSKRITRPEGKKAPKDNGDFEVKVLKTGRPAVACIIAIAVLLLLIAFTIGNVISKNSSQKSENSNMDNSSSGENKGGYVVITPGDSENEEYTFIYTGWIGEVVTEVTSGS